jgi:hypothetical protein
MKNKDQILLENAYGKIYEMAFGLGSGGVSMGIKQIMDLIIKKDTEGKNREIPFSFTSVTVPKIRKTGFPYKSLYKITQTVARLGDYKKFVNRELEKKGEGETYEPGESNVIAQRLSRSVGISKRGLPVLCMDITYIESATSIFVVREQSGEIHKIEKEEAKQYLIPSSSGPAGTSIKFRTYGFDKLVGLRIDNQEIVNSEIDSDKTEVFNYVRGELKESVDLRNNNLVNEERNVPPSDWDKGFEFPMQIGSGGKEIPFKKNGKWYLYVWDSKNKKHFYYCYDDDIYHPDTEFGNF